MLEPICDYCDDEGILECLECDGDGCKICDYKGEIECPECEDE
jgi:hypothetical protein